MPSQKIYRETIDGEYIVTCSHLSLYFVKNFIEIAEYTDRKRREGYTVVFEKDGWLVLNGHKAQCESIIDCASLGFCWPPWSKVHIPVSPSIALIYTLPGDVDKGNPSLSKRVTI